MFVGIMAGMIGVALVILGDNLEKTEDFVSVQLSL